MDAELKIQLKAQGVETLGQLDAKIRDMRKNLSLLASPEDKKRLFEMTDVQRKLRIEVNAGSAAFAQMQGNIQKVANATPSLISLNQTLQDSAFFSQGFSMGMRSVANNIQMLSQQFLFLRTQVGGTTAALRLMWTTLMGPMGLMFAVTGITVALQVLGDSTSSSFGRAKKSVEELNSRLAELLYRAKEATIETYLTTLAVEMFSAQGQKEILRKGGEKPGFFEMLLTAWNPMLGFRATQSRLASTEEAAKELDIKRLELKTKLNDAVKEATQSQEKQNVSIRDAWILEYNRALTIQSLNAPLPEKPGGATFVAVPGETVQTRLGEFVRAPKPFTETAEYRRRMIEQDAEEARELYNEALEKQAIAVARRQEILWQSVGNAIAHGIASGFTQGISPFKMIVGGILNAISQYALLSVMDAVPGLGGAILGGATAGGIGALGSLFRFANGGVIHEPVVGVGMRSGSRYVMGERGSEAVVPMGDLSGGSNGMLSELRKINVSLNSLALRVDGMDLVLGIERATQVRNRMYL